MCKIHFCDSKPLTVKLTEGLDSMCPFEPSVFGDAPGDRKGLLIRVGDEVYDGFAALEAHCRNELEANNIPNVEQLWCSSLRSDQYGKSLRCKINMAGEYAADFYDSDHCMTKPPPLKNRPINAQCHVRGVYIQKQQCGLMIDVIAVQYGEAPKEHNSPF